MNKETDIVLRNRRASEYINRKKKERKESLIIKFGLVIIVAISFLLIISFIR